MSLLSPPRPAVPPPAPQAGPPVPGAPPHPAPPAGRRAHAGPGHPVAVLLAARTVVERGWLQHGWCRTAPRPLRERLFAPAPGPDRIEAACLVAAVAAAAHAGGWLVRPERDAGPVLDRVWQALRGRPAPERTPSPEGRRERIRDLVAWNDARGRTRGEVLALLDRAVTRERARLPG